MSLIIYKREFLNAANSLVKFNRINEETILQLVASLAGVLSDLTGVDCEVYIIIPESDEI